MTYTTLRREAASAQITRVDVSRIVQHLSRLVTGAARKAGWGESDVRHMVQDATVAYFNGLSRGDAPDTALRAALHHAERVRSIEFLRSAGKDTGARRSALAVLLERQFDARNPDHSAAMQAAHRAFSEALGAGKGLEQAFDAARAASRARPTGIPRN